MHTHRRQRRFESGPCSPTLRTRARPARTARTADGALAPDGRPGRRKAELARTESGAGSARASAKRLHQTPRPCGKPEIGLRATSARWLLVPRGGVPRSFAAPPPGPKHHAAPMLAPARTGRASAPSVASLHDEKTALGEPRSFPSAADHAGGAHARDPRSAPPADFSFMSPPHDGASHPKAWSRAHRRREPLFFTRRVTISRREIDGRMTETRQQTGTTPA
jgi:hypothetical protein